MTWNVKRSTASTLTDLLICFRFNFDLIGFTQIFYTAPVKLFDNSLIVVPSVRTSTVSET